MPAPTHQTAIFIEISASSRDEYRSRVMRLVDSVNRPDTIKADIYFITNGKIYTNTESIESTPDLSYGLPGDMDVLSIHSFAKKNNYNMHIVVMDPQEEMIVPELDPEKITQLLKDI